jgi:hypothetical protein
VKYLSVFTNSDSLLLQFFRFGMNFQRLKEKHLAPFAYCYPVGGTAIFGYDLQLSKNRLVGDAVEGSRINVNAGNDEISES